MSAPSLGKGSEVKSFSRVRLFANLWTVAYQAPLSMGFSREEYWSGLPFPSPGDLPYPGIQPGSPALQADALPSELPGKLTTIATLMVFAVHPLKQTQRQQLREQSIPRGRHDDLHLGGGQGRRHNEIMFDLSFDFQQAEKSWGGFLSNILMESGGSTAHKACLGRAREARRTVART